MTGEAIRWTLQVKQQVMKYVITILLSALVLSNIALAQENLEVEGAIKINSSANTPHAGTIRWNDITQDFEGFNGKQWVLKSIIIFVM